MNESPQKTLPLPCLCVAFLPTRNDILCILVDHLVCNWRWRVAQKAQGVDMLRQKFTRIQWGYPWAPATGFLLAAFMLVRNGYTSIWPLEGSPDATNFSANYLGVPISIVMWTRWKLWHRTWWFRVDPKQADLNVNRHWLRDHPDEAKFLENYAAQSSWKRILSYVTF